MSRMLQGFIRATGKDHENFGSDEFLRPTDRPINMLIQVGDDERPLPVEPFTWGGECRIEVHLSAIANDDGVVNVFGHTSFFEGTSEDTPDEQDREIINFLVPRLRPSNTNPAVVSAHMQSGDDLADVTISLTNSIVEDD